MIGVPPDAEGFSDPVLLEGLALRMARLCTRAERQPEVDDDQLDLLAKACRFITHAESGSEIMRTKRMSGSPGLDLLLCNYTRQAALETLGEDAANGGFDEVLETLRVLLARALDEKILAPELPWSYGTLVQLWRELFKVAAHAAADPGQVGLTTRP